MDKKKKPKSKKGLIIGIVLFWLLVFVLVVIPCIRIMNHERRENKRLSELDDDIDYSYSRDYVEYDKKKLDQIVGVELREDDWTLSGYPCTKFWNNRTVPTKFDDLRFYLFDDEQDAKYALEDIKSGAFRSVTDEGQNYIRGWLEGVVDADVEMYYYQHGNLIVAASTTSVDESPRSVDDTSSPVLGGGQEAEDLIRLIRSNF